MTFGLITALLVLGSSAAHAAGSIHCEAKWKKIHFYFPVSHMEGDPLYRDIEVSDLVKGQPGPVQVKIPKEQVVGYWSGDGLFYVKALDANFNEIILELKTRGGKGLVTLKAGKYDVKKAAVSCNNLEHE